MKRFHVALSTDDLDASIKDYSKRLGKEPDVVIPDEYALWKTDSAPTVHGSKKYVLKTSLEVFKYVFARFCGRHSRSKNSETAVGLNISVRRDGAVPPGQLRHLGWEDSEAKLFTEDKDVNGITWEHFSEELQLKEIADVWG